MNGKLEVKEYKIELKFVDTPYMKLKKKAEKLKTGTDLVYFILFP